MRRAWIINELERNSSKRQPELRPVLERPAVAPADEGDRRVNEEPIHERGVAVVDFYI
ncbi:MAG: hypothetical protein R3A51_00075 [Nannocystaceae bacterium]|nr:hypothetical protein [Myxococcales bacterium]